MTIISSTTTSTSTSSSTTTATIAATVMTTTLRRLQLLAIHNINDYNGYDDNNGNVSYIHNNNSYISFPTTAAVAAEQQDHQADNVVVDEDEEELSFPWYYTLIFLFGFCVLLAMTWLLRTILIRFCGWACLRGQQQLQLQQQQQQQQQQEQRGYHNYHHLHHHHHHHHDPFYITTSDSQTRTTMIAEACDDLRDMQIQKQRQERRIWYTYYLKSYTTVRVFILRGLFFRDTRFY